MYPGEIKNLVENNLKNMLNSEVKKYLDSLEQEPKALTSFQGEQDIATIINNSLTADKKYKPTKEDNAELIAFDFWEDLRDEIYGWGTYYGPKRVMPNNEGQLVEYPSIKLVDLEMLEYWANQAKERKNPIFSSRYADLVVDFSQKILNKTADIDLFKIVIDSNITICEKLLAVPLDCKRKIKRALDLAIKIKDQERITKTKNIIIKLEKNIAVDDQPGL